jgi:predicted transcriptional regulator
MVQFNMTTQTAVKKSSAGTRFIGAYNTIDHALRTQYNFKANISFTDLIRRCASLNTVIRGYEDELIALARLRNAIVHSKSERIIAEPHDDIVELTEKIARIVATPPLAADVLKSRNVKTVRSSMSLRDLMIETNRSGYSNLPVYKNNALIGVINWKKTVEVLGGILMQADRSVDLFINHTTAEEFIREFPANEHYHLATAQITIEEVLKLFNANRKLSCVIITKTGNFLEPPMGIITAADVMDLMKVLEDF